MNGVLRVAVPPALLVALVASAWFAWRAGGRETRSPDALVTVGGDIVRDSLQPGFDLTRLSAEEEVRLGRVIDAEIRRHLALGGEPRVEAYLAALVPLVADRVERRDIPYRVTLLRDTAINAFAVAGGNLYVTQGMIDFVASEAELVAVLGHEIAHVDLGHCVERLQVEAAARQLGRGPGDLARLGYEVLQRGFSEEQELEADAAGSLLAARAFYDPWAAQALYERMRPEEFPPHRTPTRNPAVEVAQIVPEALLRYLATHPPVDRRIEAVRRALRARPELWDDQRLYVGASNLRDRRTFIEEPRDTEWVVRTTDPS